MHTWSFRAKLLGTIGGILLLLVVTNVIAIWSSRRQNATAETALSRMADVVHAHDLIIGALDSYRSQADTIINQKTDGAEFARSQTALDAAVKAFGEMADTTEEHAWAAQIDDTVTQLTTNFTREVLPRVQRLAAATDPATKEALTREIRASDDRTDNLLQTITTTANRFVESLEAESKEAEESFVALSKSTQTWIVLLSSFAVVVGAGTGLIATHRVSHTLTSIAADLSSGSDQTAAAAGQVSATSQSLAEGSSEQAASLEETSSSLEEMSSMTSRNTESAEQAKTLAQEARRAADQGAIDVQAMNTAMAEIKTSSDDIAKIIRTIDEIAFQTNILALNAAVEAARAGEAGAGFAVVAEEVRNLAQRSAAAARDSSGKIEAAIAKTANGVRITEKVAGSLQEIVGKARQVDDLVAEITNASKEQSQGIHQLNTAVAQMDKVTRRQRRGVRRRRRRAQLPGRPPPHHRRRTPQPLRGQQRRNPRRRPDHALQPSGIASRPAAPPRRSHRPFSRVARGAGVKPARLGRLDAAAV